MAKATARSNAKDSNGNKSAGKAKGLSLHIGLNGVSGAAYGGWDGPLAACEFDANDMAAIAKAKGMDPTVLLTKKATRAAVLGAMRSAAKTLGSGDFFFQTLTMNSGAVVRVTPTTRVFVRNSFTAQASFLATAGTAVQPIFFGFAGSSLTFDATFNGTLVAPNATVFFGTGSGLTFTGAFYGRTLEVRPASTLVCLTGAATL